jgi:hypothetical protein
MYEATEIIGTCINCIASESLSVTLVQIAIGALMVAHLERRKLAALLNANRLSSCEP